MAIAKIWDLDNGDEEDAEEVEIVVDPEPWEVQFVAETFAENRYSDNDYPDQTNVCVKFGGKKYKVAVEAVQTVTFDAAEPEEM